MSIFQDPYAVAALASLILQIVVLAVIIYGVLLKKKQKLRPHGMVMSVAVILHLVTIFTVMIPSFGAIVSGYVAPDPLGYISIIGLIHGITGALAFALGVFLVAAWHFSKDITGCFKRKKVMIATRALWITALVLGIAIYLIFYLPLILG